MAPAMGWPSIGVVGGAPSGAPLDDGFAALCEGALLWKPPRSSVRPAAARTRPGTSTASPTPQALPRPSRLTSQTPHAACFTPGCVAVPAAFQFIAAIPTRPLPAALRTSTSRPGSFGRTRQPFSDGARRRRSVRPGRAPADLRGPSRRRVAAARTGTCVRLAVGEPRHVQSADPKVRVDHHARRHHCERRVRRRREGLDRVADELRSRTAGTASPRGPPPPRSPSLRGSTERTARGRPPA